MKISLCAVEQRLNDKVFNMKQIEKVSRYEALLNNGIKLEIPKARYKFVEETFVSYKGEL